MKKYGFHIRKSLRFLGVSTSAMLCSASISNAQQTSVGQRDSIAIATNVDLLHKQFLTVENLYKIKKYHLPSPFTTDADSLFYQSTTIYKSLIASIPVNRQQDFFSEKFYTEIIPIAQYFRNAFVYDLFDRDRRRLYPRVEAPDPKHHDDTNPHDHSEHK